MKKNFIILICMFVFSINSDGNIIQNIESTTTLIIQNGDWEFLGNISAISQYGKKESFGLFVKVVGGKEFYQVRPLINKSYIPKYSVTRGKYIFKGVQYNASFSIYSTTYYFNI